MRWESTRAMRTLPGFDSWDSSPAFVPPRSRFYPLAPIGIGSPFVESLSGYVARIADAHAVSVGNLVVRELAFIIGSPLFQSAEPDRFYARFNAVNSLGEPAEKWVMALHTATMREDLRFLTLLPFKDLLWRLAIVRRRRTWCRVCYEEDRCTGGPVYERLLWALQSVRVCPNHRRPLEEVCPRCSRSSKPFTAYSRPGHCFQCQAWLGASEEERDSLARDACGDEDLWNANEAGRLLATASSLDSAGLRNVLAVNFQACMDLIATGLCAFAHAAHVPAETLRALIKSDGHPSLSTLLRVSYHLRVPLSTFLERDLSAPPASWVAARERLSAAQRPSRPNPDKIRAALQEATCELPPPRLCDIAARLGYVKPTRLYRVDGGLCRQILSNYQNAIRPASKSSSKQFCLPGQVKAALEESLAQEPPAPVEHIAMRLGFADGRSLYRKFPDVCRKIQDKIGKHKDARIAAMEREFNAAMDEDPPPSLGELCARLGWSRPIVLRGHFPTLCKQLLENRRAHRALQIEKLRQQLDGFSFALPPVSLEQVCKRVGFSRQQLIRICPHECAAIVGHFDRSARESKQQRIEETNRKAREVVRSLYREGKIPSFKRVRAALGKSVSQDWIATTATIRKARAELESGLGHSQSGQ